MIPTRRAALAQSGHRFSDQIMRKRNSMIPKSGHRLSDQIMHKTKEG